MSNFREAEALEDIARHLWWLCLLLASLGFVGVALFYSLEDLRDGMALAVARGIRIGVASGVGDALRAAETAEAKAQAEAQQETEEPAATGAAKESDGEA